MRKLSVFFGIVVAGIVFSFGMSVYQAVKAHHAQPVSAPVTIPPPALGH